MLNITPTCLEIILRLLRRERQQTSSRHAKHIVSKDRAGTFDTSDEDEIVSSQESNHSVMSIQERMEKPPKQPSGRTE